MNKKQRIKQILVNTFGGKCCICEYDKCLSALSFHHLDMSDKDFNISEINSNQFTYEELCELQKVILVCERCHREIHSGLHKEKLNEVSLIELEELIDY